MRIRFLMQVAAFAAAACLTLVLPARGGATIYVNGANTGPEDGATLETGWSTLAEGLGALAASNAVSQGGHTVVIAPGIYPGDIALAAAHAGIEGATNRVAATPGTVTLVGGSYGVSVNTGGRAYLVIEGLRVTQSANDGIYVMSSRDVTIRDCAVYAVLNASNGHGHGIYIGGANTTLYGEVLVDRCTLYGNAVHGIRQTYNARIRVRNSAVVNNNGFGVCEWHGNGWEVVLENNNVYGNGLGNFRDTQTGRRQTPEEMNSVGGCFGNLSDDPRFAALADDWTFSTVYTGSALLDAGADGADIGAHQDPLVVPVSANTYYVDGTAGDDARTPAEAQNPATPWATISRAAQTAFAGDTVTVANGIYAECVTVSNTGCAGYPVVFRADGAVTVDAGGGPHAFFLDRANAVTLDGFACVGAANAGCYTVMASGGVFTNLALRANAGRGLMLTGVSLFNRVSDCTAYGNAKEGFYFHRASGVTAEVCRVYSNRGYGMFISACALTLIEECDVFVNQTAEIYLISDINYNDNNPVLSSGGAIRHCNIFGNPRDGLMAHNYARFWVVESCNIVANAGYGAYAVLYAFPFVFRNNNFFANGRCAFWSKPSVNKLYATGWDVNAIPQCVGNLGANPDYAARACEGGFERLYATSPCLGAGADGLAIGRARPAVAPVSDKTYHVDAAAGDDARAPAAAANPATPWATVRRAAGTAIAGDTVRVAAGVYTDLATVTNMGAASAPLRFEADGAVTLSGAAGGFFLDRTSGVTLDGFAVTGTVAAAIALNGSYGNTVSGARVFANGGHGIALTNGANGNLVTGCDVYSNTQHGVYVNFSGGNRISRTRLRQNKGTGAYLRGAVFNTLENTVSHQNAVDGLCVDSTVPSISGDAAFVNCAFHANGRRGVNYEYWSYGNAADCVISDNPQGVYLKQKGINWMNATNCCWHGNATNVFADINFTKISYNTPAELNALAGWTNSIVANPLFRDAACGDFRIAPVSPCIDAGSAAAAYPLDLYGGKRLVGTAVDIGVFELPLPQGTVLCVR